MARLKEKLRRSSVSWVRQDDWWFMDKAEKEEELN